MYNTYTGGCNILNLQISRHKSIEVKANNNKSWDYTNPILTVGEPNRMNQNQNDMLNQSNNKNLISDHPLLPMPMNMAAAAAAAAAAAQHGHHFNPQSSNMYLTHNPHQGQQNQQQSGGPFQNSNNISAQSVSGYPMQTMDNRPAVVFCLFVCLLIHMNYCFVWQINIFLKLVHNGLNLISRQEDKQ